MPAELTPRERVRAALKGTCPTRSSVPATTVCCPNGAATKHLLHELGLAAFNRVEPYRVRRKKFVWKPGRLWERSIRQF